MSFTNQCSVLKKSKLFLKLVYSVECEETGKKNYFDIDSSLLWEGEQII